jgi:excisionase family DNA binding protein
MASQKEEALELRAAGLTYAEIGCRLGISKEWARQLANPATIKPPLNNKSKVDLEPMLKLADAACLLGVHAKTLRIWGKKGVIRVYRIGPRRDRRFKLQDVKELAATKL